MDKKAQAGLEYLMTYGWAIVLVATVVGVLVFIVADTPEEEFNISDPTSFILKGSQTADGQAIIKLQNITGGQIELTDLQANGYTNCTINGQPVEGITIGPGGEIIIECTLLEGGSRTTSAARSVTVSYTDFAGLGREIVVSIGGSAEEFYTLIESFPYSIDGPGENEGRYMLAGDSPCNSNTCITVNADNITLDCGEDNTMTGDYGNMAIHLDERTNVTVRNCNLDGFDIGIFVEDSSNNTISNNTITDTYAESLSLYNSSNNTISNNTITESVYFSILLGDSSGNTISNNTITDNQGPGIQLYMGSSNNNLSNNTVTNSSTGFYFWESPSNTVESNYVCGNWISDIRCNNSADITGSNNTADSCGCNLTCTPCS